MKTNYLYIAGLMAGIFSLSSCTNETNLLPDSEGQNVITEFVATNETGSRTILTGNNAVQWNGFEYISIMNGTQNCKFSNIIGKQGANAVFTGEILTTTGTDIYALYPYDSKASLSGNRITTTLKATQTATENSFMVYGANISVAKATAENTLAFKNVCGLIKFTVDKAVNSITLTSENAIAGDMTISMADDASNITTTMATEGGKSITLSGTLAANTAYYMVVPAITYTNPKITLDENTTVDISGLTSISRGQIISVSIKGQEADIETPENFTEYTITSITELAPEDGKDVIQLDFTSGPEFALQGVEQIKGNFKVNVTNNNGITVNDEYAVENIRLSNDNKSIILTLNKPVYTDDKISVSFNESINQDGETESAESTTASANVGGLTVGQNGVVLKTADDATMNMYKKTVYQFKFSSETVTDYFNFPVNTSANAKIITSENSLEYKLSDADKGQVVTCLDSYKFDLNKNANYNLISKLKKSNDNLYADPINYRLCFDGAASGKDIFRVDISQESIPTDNYSEDISRTITILDGNYAVSNKKTTAQDKGFFGININATAIRTGTFYFKDIRIEEELLRPGREYQQTGDNGTYQPGLITPDGDATTLTEE